MANNPNNDAESLEIVLIDGTSIEFDAKALGEKSAQTGGEIPRSPDTWDNALAYVTYTVQRGDTLWAIANKYGCTVSEIVAANSGLVKDPDLIYPGWQLTIPQA